MEVTINGGVFIVQCQLKMSSQKSVILSALKILFSRVPPTQFSKIFGVIFLWNYNVIYIDC